jgi:hypothetical protein
MMNERHALMPAQLVIGASSTLLGGVLGAGAAFGLWSQLHHTAAPGILAVAVLALAAGLILVGLAAGSLAVRLFFLVAALTLALAFFSAPGLFAALIA